MRRTFLLPALLAGCLNLPTSAEAHDRQFRSFAHQSFAHQSFGRQSFGHQSFARQSFGHRAFAPRHRAWGFAPPSGLRVFVPPGHRPGFAHSRPGRRHVVRFVSPFQAPPPLGLTPGYRILAGRQILPFVTVRRPRFPSFVRVSPGPRSGFRHDGFGIPQRRSGLTIILRDP